MPLYCERIVEQRIRRAFDYAFSDREPTHVGAAPHLELHSIDTEPFMVLGQRVIPLRLQHGPRFQVLGFRIGNIATAPIPTRSPRESWPLLEGLDVLILDALRDRPHATDFQPGRSD